jgi:hypothetical protein
MTQSIHKRQTYSSRGGGARCIGEGIDQIELDRKAAKAVVGEINELELTSSRSMMINTHKTVKMPWQINQISLLLKDGS